NDTPVSINRFFEAETRILSLVSGKQQYPEEVSCFSQSRITLAPSPVPLKNGQDNRARPY
ncbi:MAG: hypothetical protein ACFFCH_04995, partial [Promethearchaeota archaeon]